MDLAQPVFGILRGIDRHFFAELMPVSFNAGLSAIEVTFNTPQALKIITENRPAVPPGNLLGMGTICNLEEAKQAVEAGAMFLVTPNMNEKVIAYAVSQKIPIVAGAFTPTEVYRAWRLGADMIKIFPASRFGPQYIKDLRGPFNKIPLVAVGGVTIKNLDAYFDAGANAVGVGSSLFGTDALARKDTKKLFANIQNFLKECALNDKKTDA